MRNDTYTRGNVRVIPPEIRLIISLSTKDFATLLQVKGYPGADCASDHVPVIATMRVKLRKMKLTKTVKKLQFDLLRTDDEYTTQFQRHISEHMEGINTIDNVEAPNDTAYKRCSCHSRLQLMCKLCRTSPQQWGPDLPFFGACWPCGPAGWLARLLTKAGDVETNLGATTLNKKIWICDICHKQIHVRKQISIRCNRIEHWVHLRCAGICQAQKTDSWTCHLHRESRRNTTPLLTTLVQAPTHSPPPTPPQPKHRHMSNTLPVSTGLVKPKPNSLIHSPTPPRAKHIHMSHTPPTPLTSTSPVLDKTLEPRVPLIHALTTTTPHPDPTPALPSPSHPQSTHTCNTNNSTCIAVTATTARTT